MLQAVLEQHYARVGITLVNDTDELDRLIAKQPDLIFLGIKQLPAGKKTATDQAQNVWVAAYLDDAGINYTGSTADAISLDFHKPLAKQVVKTAGLQTAEHFMAAAGQFAEHELPFGYPLFIKPPHTGGGKGIGADSVVRDFVGFQQKVAMIDETFHSKALVETYLSGREFSVAILENAGSSELTAMPIELITEQNSMGDRILGQKVKAADTEHTIAVSDEIMKDKVSNLAKSVFRALGARDYGRIDIRLDEHGVPHFLEANLIPGVAYHEFTSYFTSACWINEGMDYEAMVLGIVCMALQRNVDSSDDIPELTQNLIPSLYPLLPLPLLETV